MKYVLATIVVLGLVAGCGPTAGPGGTNPPGPVRSAIVDDLTSFQSPNTEGGSIVRITVKVVADTAGTYTLHAQGGYDFETPMGTLCTPEQPVNATTCTWQAYGGGEYVGTFDIPIQGLHTNDPSTLHYQFQLDMPSGSYPFVVDVPNVYSD
jgi:hypothetical protein